MSSSATNGSSTPLGQPAFHIDAEPESGRTAVFSVHGELDLHEAPELKGRISFAIDHGARLIVVDLTHVTFIDSMALGVLLSATNRLRPAGGQIRLVVPNPNIRRVFEISQLDRVLTIDATRDEALRSARPGLSGEGPG
jgi:anti-sigma B factor antagonist